MTQQEIRQNIDKAIDVNLKAFKIEGKDFDRLKGLMGEIHYLPNMSFKAKMVILVMLVRAYSIGLMEK